MFSTSELEEIAQEAARCPLTADQELKKAHDEVRLVVGAIYGADTAEQIFQIALERLGVCTDELPLSTLRAIFRMNCSSIKLSKARERGTLNIARSRR